MIWLVAFLQAVCVLSVLFLIYIYAGFPAILWLVTRGRKGLTTRVMPDRELPSIALLIAAHNEESVIEKKVLNCQKLDYPADKLTSVFVSDSTDGTNDILRRYASKQIQVEILAKRLGKVSALCHVIPKCKGDILVFSDANTYYRPDSLRKLARHFEDPQVGVVTGDVRIEPTEETFGQGEGFYYRYERGLQELETKFWSTVAVDGAMYALRRENFAPPGVDNVGDDLVIGMKVGLRGLRILYDPEAIADEPPTPTDQMEFNRKVRIVAYGIQACLYGEGVPSLRQWRLWWVFYSHKLLRWLAPLFLLAALISSLAVALTSIQFWWAIFGVQVLFYLLALAGWKIPSAHGVIFRIPYYFSMVNLAAFYGIIRGLLRKQSSTWQRTERVRQAPGI
jgi:cellulose synthase/poly-beta-1,6-N-acetylglucosamine synthase-like glycosyltransferase